MRDPDFGDLVWDAHLQTWEGATTLGAGLSVPICIFARDNVVSDRAISHAARAALRSMRERDEELRRFAAAELLEIYNEEWSDGHRLSRAEFVARLVLENFETHEDGYSEAHFVDANGTLFEGHSIGVRIRADGSLQEAVLEG